jgi:hypothetical protein
VNDQSTELLRHLILQRVPAAEEKDGAAALTCALSFQSLSDPDRHVWIDTDLGGPGIEPGGIGVDLEGWSILGEWDDAVACARRDRRGPHSAGWRQPR